jgi:uncharacterized protein (DUF58 family)
MFPRRYISLTREGIYYVVVLAFIVGGAVLREVNLLVLLAGMMIGPLIFSWRWAALSLANLSVERRMPPVITAGSPLVVEFEIHNHRRRISSYAIVVTDTLTRIEPAAVDPTAWPQAIVPVVRPESSAATSYRCLITRRGRYSFGPLTISTRFPLGLVTSSEPLASEGEVLVCPRIGRLTRQWEKWIDADRAGSQRNSPRRGLTEGEYYGMREWRAGDSPRWIHWRTSARLNELAVKQFEEQRNGDLAVLVDLWLPPEVSDGALGNVELAVSLAATAVADLCRRGNNKLTVAVHGDRQEQWSAPASGAFCQDVLERLAVVSGTPSDHLHDVVDTLLQETPPGTRLVVFSTRTVDIERLINDIEAAHGARQQVALAKAIWIDVAREDLPALYALD